jgi:hypothetical protein
MEWAGQKMVIEYRISQVGFIGVWNAFQNFRKFKYSVAIRFSLFYNFSYTYLEHTFKRCCKDSKL